MQPVSSTMAGVAWVGAVWWGGAGCDQGWLEGEGSCRCSVDVMLLLVMLEEFVEPVGAVVGAARGPSLVGEVGPLT